MDWHSTYGLVAIEIAVILLITITVIPTAVFGDHIRQHEEYVLHPTSIFHELDEIHIIKVYVWEVERWVPFGEKCAKDYRLTEDGRCTPSKLHLDVYSLRLMTVMPEWCQEACFVNFTFEEHEISSTGIYILNGRQGDPPEEGYGCSILWYMLAKAQGYTETEIKEKWPNEECSAQIQQHRS